MRGINPTLQRRRVIRQTSGWVIATALAISIAVVAGVYLRAEYAAAPQIAVAPAPGASAEVEAGAEQETTAAPEVVPPVVTPTSALPSPSVVQGDEHFEPASPTSEPPTAIPPFTPPPDRSLHLSSRYGQHYDARSVGWDDVIDSGRSFPGVTARCARSWRNSGRDRRLNWDSARFLCMNSLSGRGLPAAGRRRLGVDRGLFHRQPAGLQSEHHLDQLVLAGQGAGTVRAPAERRERDEAGRPGHGPAPIQLRRTGAAQRLAHPAPSELARQRSGLGRPVPLCVESLRAVHVQRRRHHEDPRALRASGGRPLDGQRSRRLVEHLAGSIDDPRPPAQHQLHQERSGLHAELRVGRPTARSRRTAGATITI